MRYRLQRLGLGRGRIVDVHYPDHNVVAILVHNDYATEAREILFQSSPSFWTILTLWINLHWRDIKYKDIVIETRKN
jgi:hypothetical protein